MSGCGKVQDCDCGCRQVNPRRARRAARRSGMGAWLHGSATSARISRESAIRGGYAAGYYQPMIVPMGASGDSRAMTASERAEALARVQSAYQSNSLGAGALVFAGALVVLNLAIYGFAAYGVYRYSTRNKR